MNTVLNSGVNIFETFKKIANKDSMEKFAINEMGSCQLMVNNTPVMLEFPDDENCMVCVGVLASPEKIELTREMHMMLLQINMGLAESSDTSFAIDAKDQLVVIHRINEYGISNADDLLERIAKFFQTVITMENNLDLLKTGKGTEKSSAPEKNLVNSGIQNPALRKLLS